MTRRPPYKILQDLRIHNLRRAAALAGDRLSICGTLFALHSAVNALRRVSWRTSPPSERASWKQHRQDQKEYCTMNWERLGSAVWRGMKVLPILGYIVILAGAPAVIRRKGYLLGTVSIVLDLLPIVCLIKAALEIYLGDLIPDRLRIVSNQRLPQSLSYPTVVEL